MFFRICILGVLLTSLVRCQSSSTARTSDQFANAKLPVALIAAPDASLSIYTSSRRLNEPVNIQFCMKLGAACTNADNWQNAAATSQNGILKIGPATGLQDQLVLSLRALPQKNGGSAIEESVMFKSNAGSIKNDSKLSGEACKTINGRIHRQVFSLNEQLEIGPEKTYKQQGDLERDWYNFANLHPVVTAVSPGGQVYAGWRDRSGSTHIDTLTNSNSLTSGIKLDMTRLRDLKVDGSGLGVFGLENSRMVLRRFENGQEKWARPFAVMDMSKSMHMGRIAQFSDGSYGAYFGVHGMGGHEGDALQFVDVAGANKSSNLGWTWGCSHSIDMRIAVVNDKPLPVCISDYYPASIALRRKALVPEVQHYNGLGSGNLGGMVQHKGHMVIVESTRYSRQSRDVALVAFETGGSNKSKGRIWLTDTGNIHEVKVKIANYGDKLLVMWTPTDGSGTYTMKIIDLEFSDTGMTPTVIKEEQGVPFEIGPMEDLATTPSGDIVSVGRVANDTNKLQLQTIKTCQ